MAITRRTRARQAQRAADLWNSHCPIGTPVTYWELLRDDSTKIETRTRSEAFLAASGDAVIQLEGKSGFVALHHCRPVVPEPALAPGP